MTTITFASGMRKYADALLDRSKCQAELIHHLADELEDEDPTYLPTVPPEMGPYFAGRVLQAYLNSPAGCRSYANASDLMMTLGPVSAREAAWFRADRSLESMASVPALPDEVEHAMRRQAWHHVQDAVSILLFLDDGGAADTIDMFEDVVIGDRRTAEPIDA